MSDKAAAAKLAKMDAQAERLADKRRKLAELEADRLPALKARSSTQNKKPKSKLVHHDQILVHALAFVIVACMLTNLQ